MWRCFVIAHQQSLVADWCSTLLPDVCTHSHTDLDICPITWGKIHNGEYVWHTRPRLNREIWIHECWVANSQVQRSLFICGGRITRQWGRGSSCQEFRTLSLRIPVMYFFPSQELLRAGLDIHWISTEQQYSIVGFSSLITHSTFCDKVLYR